MMFSDVPLDLIMIVEQGEAGLLQPGKWKYRFRLSQQLPLGAVCLGGLLSHVHLGPTSRKVNFIH
jgi:hypothetical protein